MHLPSRCPALYTRYNVTEPKNVLLKIILGLIKLYLWLTPKCKEETHFGYHLLESKHVARGLKILFYRTASVNNYMKSDHFTQSPRITHLSSVPSRKASRKFWGGGFQGDVVVLSMRCHGQHHFFKPKLISPLPQKQWSRWSRIQRPLIEFTKKNRSCDITTQNTRVNRSVCCIAGVAQLTLVQWAVGHTLLSLAVSSTAFVGAKKVIS